MKQNHDNLIVSIAILTYKERHTLLNSFSQNARLKSRSRGVEGEKT